MLHFIVHLFVFLLEKFTRVVFLLQIIFFIIYNRFSPGQCQNSFTKCLFSMKSRLFICCCLLFCFFAHNFSFCVHCYLLQKCRHYWRLLKKWKVCIIFTICQCWFCRTCVVIIRYTNSNKTIQWHVLIVYICLTLLFCFSFHEHFLCSRGYVRWNICKTCRRIFFFV